MANLTITLTITNTQQLEGLEAALEMFTCMEDARRTEGGRRWPEAFPHWTDRPRGMWDREGDYWRRLFEDERTHDPRFVGPGPRWRQRRNHRRSLPWHGWLWLDSHAQWLRLFTPRSFMTKAWRSMKRIRAAAAMRKELSR